MGLQRPDCPGFIAVAMGNRVDASHDAYPDLVLGCLITQDKLLPINTVLSLLAKAI